MSEDHAAQIVQVGQAMPIMDMETARQRRESLVGFVKGLMVEGTDFGAIPGTTKPTLLKPGAEKLTTFFGLSPKFVPIESIEDWSGGQHGGEPLFAYRYKCQLFRGDLLVGEGLGSCNSWEKKYRFRAAGRRCPKCGQEAIIKGKEEYGGGWLCFAKKGGCGSKWPDGAAEIESQPAGLVKNENPHDQVNTIDKMAQKRALIAATLIAINASEFFTQDLEDMDLGGTIIEGQAKAPPPTNGGRPLAAETLREMIHRKAVGKSGAAASAAQRGLAAGALEMCFAGQENADDLRHSVLSYLFGVTSLADVSDAEVLAMLDWLKPSKDSGGAYMVDSMAAVEARSVITARLREMGQAEMPLGGM